MPPDDPRPLGSDLYGRDFHAWARAQAEALRAEARARPDAGPDWDNLIEEVEGLARADLQAVASLWLQAFVHLVKLRLAPDDPAARHWAGEVVEFVDAAADRLRPSMRQALEPEMPRLWTRARRKAAALGFDVDGLPEACPWTIEALGAAAADPAPLPRLLAALAPRC